jgi:hypothetical protein
MAAVSENASEYLLATLAEATETWYSRTMSTGSCNECAILRRDLTVVFLLTAEGIKGGPHLAALKVRDILLAARKRR